MVNGNMKIASKSSMRVLSYEDFMKMVCAWEGIDHSIYQKLKEYEQAYLLSEMKGKIKNASRFDTRFSNNKNQVDR